MFIQMFILSLPVLAQNQDNEQHIDLAEYKIVNPKVANFLNAETIKVRRFSFTDRPMEPLPVIKTRKVDDTICKNRLDKITKLFSKGLVEIEKRCNTYTTIDENFAGWIHNASGGFKYTKKKNIAKKTSFRDFKEAVNVALEFIVQTMMIRLTEGEELDIISVSTVNNAVASVKNSKTPDEQFVSDYYVSFGRRFKGIPIVGSYLSLRLDAEKNPIMIKMNWREIVGVGEVVKPMKKEIKEILYEHPDFQRAFEDEINIEDIIITQIQSGYIEAPLSFKQNEFRPGSVVSFKKKDSFNEASVQLILPLEKQYADRSILGENME